MLLITGIVLLFMGVVLFIVPDLFWQFSTPRKSGDTATPENARLLIARLTSLLWALAGAAAIFLYFRMYL